MNKVNPGHMDVILFTTHSLPSFLQGYGFRVKSREEFSGKVLGIDVFSTRTTAAWVKMVPNSSGGYTLGGVYRSKKYLLSMAQTRIEQIESRNARAAGAGAGDKVALSTSKTTLTDQAIVFSETKGVSQMFKAGTTLDEVVAVLEKRSIEIDSSFKVFYPKTGLVKKLVAVPQKVVLRFE